MNAQILFRLWFQIWTKIRIFINLVWNQFSSGLKKRSVTYRNLPLYQLTWFLNFMTNQGFFHWWPRYFTLMSNINHPNVRNTSQIWKYDKRSKNIKGQMKKGRKTSGRIQKGKSSKIYVFVFLCWVISVLQVFAQNIINIIYFSA